MTRKDKNQRWPSRRRIEQREKKSGKRKRERVTKNDGEKKEK